MNCSRFLLLFIVFVLLLETFYLFLYVDAAAANDTLILSDVEATFFKTCPMARTANLPLEMAVSLQQRVTVQASIRPFRIDINEDENMSAQDLLFTFRWKLPCPQMKMTPANANFYIDPKNAGWQPRFLNFDLQKGSVITTLQPSEPSITMSVCQRVQFFCDHGVSVRKFPFDTMICSFELLTSDSTSLLAFNVNKSMDIYSGKNFLIGKADMWELVDDVKISKNSSASFSFVNVGYYNSSEQVMTIISISYRFRRKYYAYIASLMIPLYGTIPLQVLSLAMPPKLPDRALFTVIATLANTLLLAVIFATVIPKASELTHLSVMMVIKYLCGVVITLYNLLAVPLSQRAKFDRRLIYCDGRLRFTLLRLIDCIVAVAVTIFVALADYICFHLMLID